MLTLPLTGRAVDAHARQARCDPSWYPATAAEQPADEPISAAVGDDAAQPDPGSVVAQVMSQDPGNLALALRMVRAPTTIDWNDPAVVQLEKALIFELGIKKKMRDRGPPGPDRGGPAEWRGLKWRASSQRWGSRGGRSERLKQFQAQLGKQKGKQAFLEDE